MVNQDLFTQFLRVYAFQPATAYWRAIEVSILKKFIPNSGTCLDLGCGDGKLTSILFEGTRSDNLTLVGIDGDEGETRQAAQLPLYVRVHTSLASNIPEASASFDHIISNSVLEHIEDIEATFAEVARLLKTNGSFVFTVPSPGFHRCLSGPLNRRYSREKYLLGIDKRLAHYRYWSTEEWRNILKRYGLTIERQAEYFNCSEVRRWENISRFTAGVLYGLSRQRHTPIEVQKKLGLRKAQNQLTMPFWLAHVLAALLSARIGDSQEQHACLLIFAQKLATE